MRITYKNSYLQIAIKKIESGKQKFLLAAVVMFIIGFSGCQKTLEIYAGLPMQPTNINAIYTPGLNIFGILKAGPSYDTINHFFEVHNMLDMFDTITPMIVDDAKIHLMEIDKRGKKTEYALRSYGNGRYTHDFIVPMPGKYWQYECVYDTFTVIAETYIPNTPIILEKSIKQESGALTFTIASDTTAFIYDVYFIYESGYGIKRIVPIKEHDTFVSLEVSGYNNKEKANLFVFAYDKNYENYVSTSNIFFKPNTFRPRFSTVTGGYGCFCSASSAMLEIN